MIPYATLFNMMRYVEIKRYDGIWQDWLCMQIENGAELEPWMMCLADNPINYAAVFDTRIERERLAFLSDVDEHPYTLAAGFLWMMFNNKQLDGDEIRHTIGHYDEEADIFIYESIHEPDKRQTAEKYLKKSLDLPQKVFEERIWNVLPQETKDLFLR